MLSPLTPAPPQAFHAADWRFGLGSAAFSRAKCAQHRCWVTDRKDLFPIETFDAVLFGWQGRNQKMPPQVIIFGKVKLGCK